MVCRISAAAWLEAVQNPAASGGVWGQFWENAQFGAPVPTPAPTPALTPTPLPGPVIPAAGAPLQMFICNGVLWRVLHRQAGAALIITEHVHGVDTRYNLQDIYTRLSQSNLRVALNTWAANNLGGLRYIALVPNNVDNDLRAAPGNWNAAENGAAGFTSPAARTNADTAIFVLSASEVNQYFGPTGENGNTPANMAARRAYELGTSSIRQWWTRSPGQSATHPVVLVHTDGSQGGRSALNRLNVGFRPALWIQI